MRTSCASATPPGSPSGHPTSARRRKLYTTNYLIDTWRSLGYIYSDAHGIKTGSTDEAGHCLVSSATRGSLSFISVALGGDRVTLPDEGDPDLQLL